MKTVMSQRAAVYAAVIAVLGENNIPFEDGQDVSKVLTKEMRTSVHSIVVAGFREGTVEFEDTPANKEKLASESKLNSYVSGLISNWIRKDKRFNGNVSYVPKNPGSRTGQGDEQLKTLRALKRTFAGQPDREAIVQKEIDKRVSELAATRAKADKLTPEQIAQLPAELLESLGMEIEG